MPSSELVLQLRKRKAAGERLSRKDNFKLLASDASLKWNRQGGWSDPELRVKEILSFYGMEEKVNYLHNFKIQNEAQTQFYSLDFFFPDPRMAIEVSPDIWHKDLGNTEEKDRRKLSWMERIGIKVHVIDSAMLARQAIPGLHKKIGLWMGIDPDYVNDHPLEVGP